MSESLRRRAGFKKHLHLAWPGRQVEQQLNLVVAPADDVPTWLSETSAIVPELRADVRDVYMRWAITINAMHIAQERYKESPEKGLVTKAMRTDHEGSARIIALDTWAAADAARNYALATPPLSAYAFADLFGLFEEIVFEVYLIFLNNNPESLLKGEEFRTLRRLYRDRERDRTAFSEWETAWADRLSTWRRKRLYDGLHRVFANFWRETKLKRPSYFQSTDVENWCQTIRAVAELRNLITHGVGEVNADLAAFCRDLQTNVFVFKEGDVLDVNLDHLMFLECFLDQLLTTLGAAVLEAAYGPVLTRPAPKSSVT